MSNSCRAKYTPDGLRLFEKTPGDVKDYGFSYQYDLEAGESLNTSVWAIVTGTGGVSLNIDNDAVDATTARVDLSGGAVGDEQAKLENTVTTVGGAMVRTYVKRFALDIVEELGK